MSTMLFFFWSELKLERDFPVFVSILFSIGSKTKCIGHWGLLHHLCHPCLLWPPVVRECMQSGNDDRYRGITYNDTDDFSKYCTDFFQKFLKGLPSKPKQNLSSKCNFWRVDEKYLHLQLTCTCFLNVFKDWWKSARCTLNLLDFNIN